MCIDAVLWASHMMEGDTEAQCGEGTCLRTMQLVCDHLVFEPVQRNHWVYKLNCTALLTISRRPWEMVRLPGAFSKSPIMVTQCVLFDMWKLWDGIRAEVSSERFVPSILSAIPTHSQLVAFPTLARVRVHYFLVRFSLFDVFMPSILFLKKKRTENIF